MKALHVKYHADCECWGPAEGKPKEDAKPPDTYQPGLDEAAKK